MNKAFKTLAIAAAFCIIGTGGFPQEVLTSAPDPSSARRRNSTSSDDGIAPVRPVETVCAVMPNMNDIF